MSSGVFWLGTYEPNALMAEIMPHVGLLRRVYRRLLMRMVLCHCEVRTHRVVLRRDIEDAIVCVADLHATCKQSKRCATHAHRKRSKHDLDDHEVQRNDLGTP